MAAFTTQLAAPHISGKNVGWRMGNVRQLQEIMARCAMKRSGLGTRLSNTGGAIPETACIIIGRLAVDQRIAGKGFGTQLALDALRVAYSAADAVGIYAVMVEAKDDKAAGFYREAMRFIPLKTEDGKLKFFFPVASIAPLL